jgi:hypothetical protein
VRGRRHGQRDDHRAPLSIVFKLVVGALFLYLALRVGFGILRMLATPIPPPPPAGEMRRLNQRYRCSVCGVELRVTAAPNQEPEAPRHCMEDMELTASPDE